MGPNDSLPKPVLTAIEITSEETGLRPDNIDIVQIEHLDWPDASLGYPEPEMTYAQQVTPGYRVVLRAGGQELRFHTDEHNRVIRTS